MDGYRLLAGESRPKQKGRGSLVVTYYALIASICSAMTGYCGGVMSGAILFIRKDLNINYIQEEILMGSLVLISLVGGIIAGLLADTIGLKKSMLVAAIIVIAGSGMMGLAPSFWLLLLGRVITGIGYGFSFVLVPLYIAEVSPPEVRGRLLTFQDILGNGGILLGYVSSFCLAQLPVFISWRLMVGLGALPAIILAFAGVFSIPESPRWLLLWPTSNLRRIMFVALGLQFFQQASGIGAILFYSPLIFDMAGFQSNLGNLGATVLVGIIKVAFLPVATIFLDRFGRRPLLLISNVGMAACMSTLAIRFAVIQIPPRNSTGTNLQGYLTVAACCSFMAFFSVGFGPICFSLPSEIFPLRLRAQGVSLSTAFNRFLSGVLSVTFLSILKLVGAAGTFSLFAGMSTISIWFVYFCVPETKGRTLEELSPYLHDMLLKFLLFFERQTSL
ncbi:hypothetical protein O6H91_03G121400 [Diphasiastrum complanatum]|uniref:Uncharacterized protein n=1 Tax=Diphasiastrum complanatum TaxID=34168 RepID=A0ACC2EB03_DIPCM|nr:hypothetical protein O6H91_03G121400 [Diphasiastrum complanatum]